MAETPTGEPPNPVARAVLLGASNLTMGLREVVAQARRCGPGPVEVLAACGHGRSFGQWSTVAGVRSLPGILGCELWRALAAAPSRPTVALVTDVGNDLLYGAEPATIAAWVERCLERLRALDARVVLTPLPMASIEALSPWRYHLVRSLLFPFRPRPWSAVLARARDLDRRLHELAATPGVHLARLDPGWYRFDAIHLRRSRRRQAWACILAPWGPLPAPQASSPPQPSCRSLPGLRAAEQRLLGLRLRTRQPSCRFADGSTLSRY